MAKKEKLSPEELLEQALVKEEEQPYAVSDNWVWVKFASVIDLISGRDLPLHECNDNKIGIPYIMGASNIENGNFIVNRWTNKPSVIGLSGDVLLSVKGTVGKIALLKEDRTQLSRQIMALRAKQSINSIFLMYILSTSISSLIQISRGLIPGISREDVLNIKCPLPPLPEQQRIVAVIESLFEKLDRAKELAQNALDSFENRKSAILHKAFSGELTRKWREENGVVFERDWQKRPLEEVCISIADGDHQPPPQSENGIPFLVISNITSGKLDFNKTRFVSSNYYDRITAKRRPQKGDILYSIVGSYGIPALVDQDRQFCFQRHIALFKPRDINNKYLYYILQSSEIYQQVSQIATGTAQLTVPIKGLRKIEVFIPPSTEQQEIVRILDNLLENEQKAKELCDVIDKIDHMKKSILARAFRGELGTNNPTEESALELLREVLKAKA